MYVHKDVPVTGEVYHVFTKSIAGYRIFNTTSEFSRILAAIRYYQRAKPPVKFSRFIQLNKSRNNPPFEEAVHFPRRNLVAIIAFCIMPNHLHLLLKQSEEKGISVFMSNILNSYTRYFNIRHNRKGPLYEGRFKKVLVQNDKQLYHLTRYIHLNPVTANLVDRPQDWVASSYNEYMNNEKRQDICTYNNLLDIEPHSYKHFVESRKNYQKELARIKKLLID